METENGLTKKMPKKTKLAVYLIYIYLLVVILEFTYFDLISNENLLIAPSILLILTQVFIIGFLGFKIGHGKNWARIILLVLLILGIISNAFSILLELTLNIETINTFNMIRSLVVLIGGSFIIFMLFNRESNKWFKEEKTITKPKKLFAQNQMKVLTLIGLVCMLIPVLIFAIWIHASNIGNTQIEAVDIFHNYFPDFLRGRYDSAIISIIFSIIAIILSGICLKIKGKIWKVVNVVILVVCSLLLFLNLFSMM